VPHDYPIHVVIHQPRVGSGFPKEAVYTHRELYEFLEVIWQSIQVSKQKDLQPVEGNHCFWCPARRTKDQTKKCPAILEKPMRLVQENFQQFLTDMQPPADMPMLAVNPKRDAALLKLFALKPLIDEVVANAIPELEHRLMQGEVVSGFTIKQVEGNREIIGENAEEKAKLIASKFSDVNPWRVIPAVNKLKTLTELEKEIGKKKLDTICTKRIKKQVDILPEGQQKALQDLIQFGMMLTTNSQEE
jgi:hypothetical protein